MKHKKKNKVNKGWDIAETARRITCANWWQGIINLQSTKLKETKTIMQRKKEHLIMTLLFNIWVQYNSHLQTNIF